MLIHAEQSSLLVIDVQEKLVPALHEASRAVAAMRWLIQAARLNNVPVVFTEQYPRGLGPTLPCLTEAAPEAPVFSKTTFSCVAGACLPEEPTLRRPQIVICGIEAHVCVLQTALDLHTGGRSVFVVADAISGRGAQNSVLALQRLQAAGVQVVSREMVLFEWMRDSRAAPFREASQTLLQRPPALSFAQMLTTLPDVSHLASLQLWRDGKLDSVIENKSGQTGSLAVYHALYRQFGAITPKAGRLGQWLYAEHAEDAQQHPGKHPNIDRLFALETMGGGYGVRLQPR